MGSEKTGRQEGPIVSFRFKSPLASKQFEDLYLKN